MSLLFELFFWAKQAKLGKFSALFGQATAPIGDPVKFPRVIYVFWDTGFDNAPWIVEYCVKSWQRHNPGWKLKLMDQKAANAIVAKDTLPEGISTAHYADMLRVTLLKEFGGVWVDATCYCMRPLDDWLPWVLSQSDFFVFQRPAYDRAIANWFIASEKSGLVISFWQKMMLKALRNRARPPSAYFWSHYIFEFMMYNSRKLRKSWRNSPSLSAVPLHLLQKRLASRSPLSHQDMCVIAATPVQKLTYKMEITERSLDAALENLSTFSFEDALK